MASEQQIKSSGVGTASAPQVTPQAPAAESAGVEMLIARLHDEGIAQGRSQAQALVTAAKQQAADIVAAAKREAEAVPVTANEETKRLKAFGEDAIRLAMRDSMRSLEADLTNRFQNMLRGLVKGVLQDPAFLQRLILEVGGKAASSAERAELLIPAEVVSLEDLQRKPEEAKPGTL